MKSAKFLPALKGLVNTRRHTASPGERVIGSLFPNRGAGWPGAWSSNRVEQIYHMRNWVYTALNCICSKVASITPNFAYVIDGPTPSGKHTVKACQRGLLNLMEPGKYGGNPYVGAEYDYRTGYEVSQSGAYYGTSKRWEPSALVSGGGHSFLTYGEYRSKALSVVKPHEELEPLENDHPLRRLWENPNTYDTAYDRAYEESMFNGLCGVDYTWKVPNQWGRPSELWTIPSHWVWPKTGGGRYLDPNHPDAERLIWYYEIRPWGGTYGSAGILKIPPDEMIVHRCKSPLNKIDGYSPLSAIAQWVDSEESITASRWAQFQNQARPEFWVELGAGYEDPTDDRIARMEAKFASKYMGEYNYGKPVITPPGAKITPLSFNPTEMAYFQSEEQIRDMILSGYMVPKTAVGISTDMTYGSVLATLATLCSQCLNPKLTARGQTYTKELGSIWDEPAHAWGSPSGHGGRGTTRRVRIWYDDCVPADPSQVNADLAQDVAAYALTPNEQRALRGRRPYRFGGDDPIVNGPGGPTPLPLNTGANAGLEELARLMAPMAQQTEQGEEQPPQLGNEGDEQPGAEEQEPTQTNEGKPAKNEPEEGANQPVSALPTVADQADDASGIKNPNGKPSKRLISLAKSFYKKLANRGSYTNGKTHHHVK